MYVDLCGFRPGVVITSSVVEAQRAIEPGCVSIAAAGVAQSSNESGVSAQQLPRLRFNRGGGGDGQFFEAGELVDQVVPKFNEQTGEAIAQFGARQEQILFTNTRNPVAHGSDPACRTAPPCTAVNPDAGTTPLIIIFTVDIDSNAPPGLVDVLLGLQSFDDTAINIASGGTNPCRLFFRGLPTAPMKFGAIGLPGACGSNFMNPGPEVSSFSIESQNDLGSPNNLNAFDTDSSCFISDPEFFRAIDFWVDNQVGANLFFNVVDAWVAQEHVCTNATSSSNSSLRLTSVNVSRGNTTTLFSATGQGIDSMAVDVLSLDGQRVFRGASLGTSLSWNQMTASGAPIANGTYLYVISVHDRYGNVIVSEVKKLAVVR